MSLIVYSPDRYETALYDTHGGRKYLNWSEHDRFLAAADAFAPQIRCLAHFLAMSGCRISEALHVCGHHISPGEVVVRSLKRRKLVFRVVQLPEALTDAMMDLASTDNADDRIWAVSRSTAYRWIRSIMRRAGIAGPQACPKGLRHSFGVRNLMKGVPPNLVKRWLGHASLRSTMVYAEAVGEEERAFARRAWAYGS